MRHSRRVRITSLSLNSIDVLSGLDTVKDLCGLIWMENVTTTSKLGQLQTLQTNL